jgi:hypothetical protein
MSSIIAGSVPLEAASALAPGVAEFGSTSSSGSREIACDLAAAAQPRPAGAADHMGRLDTRRNRQTVFSKLAAPAGGGRVLGQTLGRPAHQSARACRRELALAAAHQHRSERPVRGAAGRNRACTAKCPLSGTSTICSRRRPRIRTHRVQNLVGDPARPNGVSRRAAPEAGRHGSSVGQASRLAFSVSEIRRCQAACRLACFRRRPNLVFGGT